MVDKAEENEVIDDFEIIDTEVSEAPEVTEQVEAEAVEEILEAIQPNDYFKSEHKDVFNKLTDMEGGRDIQEAWNSQWSDVQSDYTKKYQELSGWQKEQQTFNEYQQAINPLMDNWKLQGMNPAMGLAQLAQYGVGLQSDPNGTLMRIAEAYNIDVSKLLEDQPYVDPQVRELKQQQAQMQQQTQQQQQMMQNWQQEQHNNSITQQINAFSTATDSNGKLVNEHYKAVEQEMANIITHKRSQGDPNFNDLAAAYKQAVKYNQEIQAEIQKAELAKNQAEVKKATNATIGINKTNTPPDDDLTLEQSIEASIVYN